MRYLNEWSGHVHLWIVLRDCFEEMITSPTNLKSVAIFAHAISHKLITFGVSVLGVWLNAGIASSEAFGHCCLHCSCLHMFGFVYTFGTCLTLYWGLVMVVAHYSLFTFCFNERSICITLMWAQRGQTVTSP